MYGSTEPDELNDNLSQQHPKKVSRQLLGTEEQENQTGNNGSNGFLARCQNFALLPEGDMDHFCYVPMHKIAVVWVMVLGIVLIFIDLLNFLLEPLGGIMNECTTHSYVSSCLCAWVCLLHGMLQSFVSGCFSKCMRRAIGELGAESREDFPMHRFGATDERTSYRLPR